jgi:hypothetical protein
VWWGFNTNVMHNSVHSKFEIVKPNRTTTLDGLFEPASRGCHQRPLPCCLSSSNVTERLEKIVDCEGAYGFCSRAFPWRRALLLCCNFEIFCFVFSRRGAGQSLGMSRGKEKMESALRRTTSRIGLGSSTSRRDWYKYLLRSSLPSWVPI